MSPVLCCVSQCVPTAVLCVPSAVLCVPVCPHCCAVCPPGVPLLLRPCPFPTQGAATVSSVASTAFCLVMQTWETRERHKLGSLESFCCLNPFCKQLLENASVQNLCVNSCSLCQVLIFLITLIMDSMKRHGKLIVKSSGGSSWGWTLLLPSALRTRSRWVMCDSCSCPQENWDCVCSHRDEV